LYSIFIKHDQRLQNCQARIVKNFHTTVIGVMIGLSPEKALALALVKRFREIVVGVPGLIWWFGIEGRHVSPQSTDK
jgi:hypothetical protein